MTARQGGARIKRRLMFALEIAIAVSAIVSGSVQAQVKSFEGLTLKLASQNDQFAAVLADLTPEFKQATGVTVKVDILSYPDLLTKMTADFVGHTKSYDLYTTDIVWAGQLAASGSTVVLNDLIKRDAAEIKVDDIYP